MSVKTAGLAQAFIIVLGASGDLATRKIFPALFSLYCKGCLPAQFKVIGFSRTPFTDDEFRRRITGNLTCRYAPGESCSGKMDAFLTQCSYASGDYSSLEAFNALRASMDKIAADAGWTGDRGRLFYMALPPDVFMTAARSMKAAGLITEAGQGGWTRVVVEKPFGRDSESSHLLASDMAETIGEERVYRIDHYLGKEVIQNLLAIRFANLVFEPVWNRDHVAEVKIRWKEKIGVEGRGGYFDNYGIIRDVVQNHLLQMLALTAMEQPVGLDAESIKQEKVKVLRGIEPLAIDDVIVGQYAEGVGPDGKTHSAYLKEKGVPPDSITPTYFRGAFKLRNRRWDGVPFLIEAGKALNEQITEIRIVFKSIPGDIFRGTPDRLIHNEVVIRVQPQESILLLINNKRPGEGLSLVKTHLDLVYAEAFKEAIPDAYESLILDVFRGDKSLFISHEELAAAWDIFTPLLKELEAFRSQPDQYEFGGEGPSTNFGDKYIKTQRWFNLPD